MMIKSTSFYLLGSATLLIAALLVLQACTLSDAYTQVPPEDQQIAAAVQPLPEHERERARVLGYDEDGALVTLRDGDGFTCLSDDPGNDDEFHVACYVDALEPFMERGRALRAEGHTTPEVYEIRRQEIENGALSLPDSPSALYSLSGPSNAFDYERGVLLRARALHVVYVPYATGEETGLPTSPVGPGVPWLMDEGEPWAHIMYSTGQEIGEEAEE